MKQASPAFFFGLFICGLGVSACSPAPAPVSTSQRDPSNPNAPEGVTMPVPAASSAATTTSAPSDPHAGHAGHSSHQEAAPAATDAGTGGGDVVYVCPMHPEVTSTKPGSVCPKCNMKLVPKK